MSSNSYLIGVPGSRDTLDTPALIVDRGALLRNIERMARFARLRGVGLRPHVKSHKSVDIARVQIAAGALGVCCATLGEAEVMVDAGIRGVLITSPVVTANKMHRLVALARRAGPDSVMVVVDHPRNAMDLAAHATALSYRLPVLIDYHAGFHRTGVADQSAALELAGILSAVGSLEMRGVQAYGGNLQHIPDRQQRAAAAAALRKQVSELVGGLEQAGSPVRIVTGVGTGTHEFDYDGHVFTEMQAGSYVFMDVEYNTALTDADHPVMFETSLFVQGTVVSANAPDWVTVDAGIKSFATDSVTPVVSRGVKGPARYAFFGDEHGKLIVATADRPALGAHVEFVTPHCDPTVNLHGMYHVIDGETLVDIWPVSARGQL